MTRQGSHRIRDEDRIQGGEATGSGMKTEDKAMKPQESVTKIRQGREARGSAKAWRHYQEESVQSPDVVGTKLDSLRVVGAGQLHVFCTAVCVLDLKHSKPPKHDQTAKQNKNNSCIK